jgi:membrane protein implicated in regulation of membrane protease activity
MEYGIAVIVLVALVALVVARPFSREAEVEAQEEVEREELEAAKEAKYREIRDAELDHRMGKVSEQDWRAVDRALRGEAIEILRRLDRLEGRPPSG